ncbi:MAG: hypothetical protein IPG90_10700 [Bacteroidetes bacterium]|nr:hypothetical protein [Bacteroidota bacterium]
MNRKLLVRSAIVLTFILVTMVLGYFLFRNMVLQSLLTKISGRLNSDYQMNLNVKEAGFTGLTTVVMTGVTLIPIDGDTLLHLDSLRAEPSFSS